MNEAELFNQGSQCRIFIVAIQAISRIKFYFLHTTIELKLLTNAKNSQGNTTLIFI